MTDKYNLTDLSDGEKFAFAAELEDALEDPTYFDGWMEEEDAHAAKWEELLNNRSQLPEVQQQALKRWRNLEALQNHYTDFKDFLYDAMTELMGFDCTDIQLDMGDYLQHGPRYSMIQAQRSQAKSTIVAMYAVWCLIHDPKKRILIISAGADVALEIANWVIQIIMSWDILECMRPDRQHGDRASAKAFDIHWQLKGVEKSPSVACIGVTANMQGRRADILVPDDIESSKNGLTETQRQHLIHLSRDFTSICQNGRIIYLGTPQTNDSIYNTLPGRGYEIRIWPGRYPTVDEEDHYGDYLAPLIRERMEADPLLRSGYGVTGESGAPTDPILLPEQILIDKELDQGPAYFQLQHMLNTKLSDATRYPLNTRNLIVMDLNPDVAPSDIQWMPDKKRLLKFMGFDHAEFYSPWSYTDDRYDYESSYVYVDTAGGGENGDETVATALKFLHGYLFVMAQLCLPGGYDQEVFDALSAFCLTHRPNEIGCEQNHGYGAFAKMWAPTLLKAYKEVGENGAPKIIDDWVSQQKELRIADTLDPIMARHRLVMNRSIIENDWHTVQKYPIDQRMIYTLTNQMNKLTRERGALIHDDRLDSLAGAVRRYVERMAVDEKLRESQKVTSENMKMMAEWSKQSLQTNKNVVHESTVKQRGIRGRRRRKRH
ncbi:MAG: phage terminase large subunit [Desulfobulbaceae bacterium]|nr:phage terminase large subunit [Desulfobulbaceae bacterium]